MGCGSSHKNAVIEQSAHQTLNSDDNVGNIGEGGEREGEGEGGGEGGQPKATAAGERRRGGAGEEDRRKPLTASSCDEDDFCTNPTGDHARRDESEGCNIIQQANTSNHNCDQTGNTDNDADNENNENTDVQDALEALLTLRLLQEIVQPIPVIQTTRITVITTGTETREGPIITEIDENDNGPNETDGNAEYAPDDESESSPTSDDSSDMDIGVPLFNSLTVDNSHVFDPQIGRGRDRPDSKMEIDTPPPGYDEIG